MTMMQILDGEDPQVAIEFAALLVDDETLSSATSVTVDPTGELELGSPSISGTQMVFTADATSATVVGHRYRITGTAVKSTGKTVKEYATVALL